MAARGKRRTQAEVIIRREQTGEGAAHHGGAWKVAYADFVTAMMAFFLLMWLINATTEDQRKGLADYFSDQNVASRHYSGFGEPFGGRTPNAEGAMLSDRGSVQAIQGNNPVPADTDDDRNRPFAPLGASEEDTGETMQGATAGGRDGKPADAAVSSQADRPGTAGTATAGNANQSPAAAQTAGAQAAAAAAETKALEQAAHQLRDAVRADPALAGAADQLKIEVTPEGLRIQLEDAERQPMFATGSSALSERAGALLQKVAPVLAGMPQEVSISGHTDAAPYPGPDRTNWELSSDRANATRRLLAEQGIAESRFRSVVGRADRELLVADDPLAPANRRIAILVHRQVPLADSGSRVATGAQQAGVAATPATAADPSPLPPVLARTMLGAAPPAAPAQR